MRGIAWVTALLCLWPGPPVRAAAAAPVSAAAPGSTTVLAQAAPAPPTPLPTPTPDLRPRALVVISPVAFEESELRAVLQALRRRHARIWIVSTQSGRAKGMNGGEVPVRHTLEQVQAEAFDLLAIIGGSGAKMYLWFNPGLTKVIQTLHARHRPIGAIAVAPAALAHAGILTGREATVLATPETLKLFALKRVKLQSRRVVVDGKLVTADTTAAAEAFAGALAQLLPARTAAAREELRPPVAAGTAAARPGSQATPSPAAQPRPGD